MNRVLFLLLLLASSALAEPPALPGVFTIMEDDAEGLLKVLNNPWGDSGTGHVEDKDTFSGSRCIRVVPLQRYSNAVGWELKIREKPRDGEYRYLRFAWKSVGGSGIMVQLSDTDWNLRYVAGNNTHGWAAKSVAEKAPDRWTVVTRDLFADFGDRDLKGIALTAFDGECGLFDHIHVARTLAGLDRICIVGTPEELTTPRLEECWRALGADDDREGYRAKCKLANDPARTVPFLRGKLPVVESRIEPAQIATWVKELDDEKFAKRENARRMLEKHLAAAAGILRLELERTISAETRRVVERLLKLSERPHPDQLRQERGISVLEIVNSPEARKLLIDLAKGADGARLTVLAREALQRKLD